MRAFIDKQGKRLEVGDKVVTYYSSGYIGVIIGTIEGFTPKMVKVKTSCVPTVLRAPQHVVAL